MPCMQCSDGKWRYGDNGDCVFDTLERCRAAEAAIHAQAEGDKLVARITKEILELLRLGRE